MQHIPSRKLVQTELRDAVEMDIHSPQRPDKHHADCLAVLISDITHDPEQQIHMPKPPCEHLLEAYHESRAGSIDLKI